MATLAVRGPRAWNVVRDLFHFTSDANTHLPDNPEPGRIWLGRLGTDLADDVVLSVKQAEPIICLELHCHGGREVVRYLLELLASRDVLIVSWPMLAIQPGQSKIHAMAAAALVEARTTRTAAILLDQYHGAFEQTIRAILRDLDSGDLNRAVRKLSELKRHSSVGRHLIAPWRVAIAGAPNVGKSSLLNALAGYQRSVVAPTPGTTRDVVTTILSIDGWPIEWADTAGIRDSKDVLEEEGVIRARSETTQADLCLWVLDAGTIPVWPANTGQPDERTLFVINKIDLTPAWNLDEATGATHVSAKTGAGLPELGQRIANWLVPEPPPAGTAVPFTPSLCETIETALEHCRAGNIQPARTALQEAIGD